MSGYNPGQFLPNPTSSQCLGSLFTICETGSQYVTQAGLACANLLRVQVYIATPVSGSLPFHARHTHTLMALSAMTLGGGGGKKGSTTVPVAKLMEGTFSLSRTTMVPRPLIVEVAASHLMALPCSHTL